MECESELATVSSSPSSTRCLATAAAAWAVSISEDAFLCFIGRKIDPMPLFGPVALSADVTDEKWIGCTDCE